MIKPAPRLHYCTRLKVLFRNVTINIFINDFIMKDDNYYKTHLPHTRFIFLFPDSYGRKFGIDDEVEFHLTT